MTEMVKSSLKYRVLHANILIPEVKHISEPKGTTAKTDNSSQDNLYDIKTHDVGMKDTGDMAMTIGDTGGSLYSDLLTLWKNGTKQVWEIAYAPINCGRAITFTGFISGIEHKHADDGGPQTIEISITPCGYITALSTGATGLTTPWLSVADDDSHALTLSPTASGTVYDYECTAFSSGTENINSETVLVTPTGSGTIYVNGVVVTSGQASGAITINQTQGDVTMIGIACCEVGKASKTYLLRVKMGTAAYSA
jgi:hypothetical protein